MILLVRIRLMRVFSKKSMISALLKPFLRVTIYLGIFRKFCIHDIAKYLDKTKVGFNGKSTEYQNAHE